MVDTPVSKIPEPDSAPKSEQITGVNPSKPRSLKANVLQQMNSFTIFRASVVAAPGIALLAVAYTLTATSTFSQDWQDILSWSGDGDIFSDEENYSLSDLAVLVVAFAFILVAIGNQVALFFYWRPSRVIFLWVTVLGFLATPFLGLTVSPPLETLGYELSVFISGMTLALAYFSPVADKFK